MNIDFEIDPNKNDVEALWEGLVAYNKETSHDQEVTEFGCFIRDDEGDLDGGASGEIIGSIAIVRTVWIDRKLRGLGVGKKIFDVLEAEFHKRKVKEIHLNTHNFQSPEFYQKLGFKEVARYTVVKQDNIEKIFFIKEL